MAAFFKAQDPEALAAWYRDVLEFEAESGSAVTFGWSDDPQPGGTGHTVWGPFRLDTTYFHSSDKPYMINFRVDDLGGVLARLR